MFTKEQLETIDFLLKTGYTPDQIAGRLEMAPATFRYKLLKGGWQIAISRRLVKAGESMSVEEDAEPLALAG